MAIQSTVIRCVILCTAILAIASLARAQNFSVLHSFTNSGGQGAQPFAGLTMDRAGNLYGTTYFGSNAYKLTWRNGSWTYANLFDFSNNGGYFPDSRLFIGPDGAFYGTTVEGGSNDYYGVVYKLTPPPVPCRTVSCPWTETVLFNFNGDDGSSPSGDLTFDSSGNLYGVANVAYELTPAQGLWTETILHQFPPDDTPYGGLTFDQAGDLYGTTYMGDGGTVYELTNPSRQLQVLHQFDYHDGSDTLGGVIFDTAGNLYGGAMCGGANGEGDIFEMSPSGSGWTFKIIYNFTTGDQNYCGGPYVGLTMDAGGNIYGTTHSGGTALFGSVFKLSPSGSAWTFTDLHDFCAGGPPCTGGQYPFSNVVMDSQGNLYGTASQGGADNEGVVWEITP